MTDKESLKQSFLEAWPLERVKNMSIEEYTNINREDSFCYWLETKTESLGSIWGGSAYKFGIYRRYNTDKVDSRSRYETDGEYAWALKYGSSRNEVFSKVKNIIIEIIQAVQQKNFRAIDSINLGDAIKWKIAFLYSDYEIINAFKKDGIYSIANQMGLKDANQKPISELHKFLISKKPEDEPFFDYTTKLWDMYNNNETENTVGVKSTGLNTILFGPPGTGKTYHTVDYALKIVDSEFYEQHKNNRADLVKRFRELVITDWDNPKQGRIATTTFHQSFTYEDFIEGIKPQLNGSVEQNDNENSLNDNTLSVNVRNDNGHIYYSIVDGIFKRMSELARQGSGGDVEKTKRKLKWDPEQFEKAEFYKISLGDANIPADEEIYNYCIKSNKIAIGFINEQDLSNKSEADIKNICENNSERDNHECLSVSYFIHNLKKDYYVIIPNGNHKFRAIGRVTGEYEYNPKSAIRYNHFRNVEWLVTDLDLPVNLIYNNKFSQKTIYHLRKKDINPEFFINTGATETTNKSYVLIIDEINRGNIAEIFGELITLIEEDKREGKPEKMEVTLPYSKKPFSVPSNLFIIGTMNTADRSVEALDTALRRRFLFTEIPPKPTLINNEKNGSVLVNDLEVSLSDLLATINERIEKILDKDHMIGHSYFMKVNDFNDLQNVFHQNIIPLLEEYFYGDKGKIQLVLGKGFVSRIDEHSSNRLFPNTDYDDKSLFEERAIWRIRKEWIDNEKEFAEALKQLNIQNRIS